MASILNSSFGNVFTNENNIVVPTTLKIFQGSVEKKLNITEIQTHEVCKYLQKIVLTIYHRGYLKKNVAYS